jgi:hypothetical protein
MEVLISFAEFLIIQSASAAVRHYRSMERIVEEVSRGASGAGGTRVPRGVVCHGVTSFGFDAVIGLLGHHHLHFIGAWSIFCVGSFQAWNFTFLAKPQHRLHQCARQSFPSRG